MCMSEEDMVVIEIVGAIILILKRARDIGIVLPVLLKDPATMNGGELEDYCAALLETQNGIKDELIISHMNSIRRKIDR